jgi:hypothetical protein
MPDNRYLSKNKIQELLDYLNKNLDTKTRVVLLKLKNDHNISLTSDVKNNTQTMWTLAFNEINSKIDWLAKMKAGEAKDLFIGSGAVIREYLNTYYPIEWGFAQNFNYDSIQWWLNNFTNENFVQGLQINELLECKNYSDLLNEKYSEKLVTKKSKEHTATVKKLIDDLYKDYAPNTNEFYSIRIALDTYTMEKDEHRLHNMLNTLTKW